MQILSLGDSYTIGEGVDPSQRWPAQLVTLARAYEHSLGEPVVIAQTGWTTDELAAAVERTDPQGPFDLVTLQIGVNDQYRGRDEESYRAGFRRLLETAIELAGDRPEQVIVVSIPDWGVTPFAVREGREPATVRSEIDRFNEINREEAKARGAHWIDVTSFSRHAGAHPTMLVDDGLHPSGMMYAEWARLILPAAREALSGR